jgi:hypothetical protein
MDNMNLVNNRKLSVYRPTYIYTYICMAVAIYEGRFTEGIVFNRGLMHTHATPKI